MDPHLLRTFVAVVRCGSFSGAARELGYTQSAVSQHIAALESELGAVLLLRRPVTPTAVGARLLEHAGPLLLRWAAARADIARLTAAPPSRLAVAVSSLAMTPQVSGALATLRHTNPGLAITVRVLGREAVPRAVATGAADAGLVDGMAAPTDPLPLPDIGLLTSVAIVEQPLAVALPAGHPLANRPGLRLVDLADAWWVDGPDTALPLARLRTMSGCDGYRASLCFDGTDPRGLIALVAAGHGLALLPRSAIDGVPGVVAVPVIAPRLVHRTELLHGSASIGPTLAAALTGREAPDPGPT